MFNFFKKEDKKEQEEQEEHKGVEMVAKHYCIYDSMIRFKVGYLDNKILIDQNPNFLCISITFDELTEFTRQFNEVIEKIQKDIKNEVK